MRIPQYRIQMQFPFLNSYQQRQKIHRFRCHKVASIEKGYKRQQTLVNRFSAFAYVVCVNERTTTEFLYRRERDDTCTFLFHEFKLHRRVSFLFLPKNLLLGTYSLFYEYSCTKIERIKNVRNLRKKKIYAARSVVTI